MAIFYTGNMLAASFSGLIAAAVFSTLDGRNGLAGWRWCVIPTEIGRLPTPDIELT